MKPIAYCLRSSVAVPADNNNANVTTKEKPAKARLTLPTIIIDATEAEPARPKQQKILLPNAFTSVD